jgi:hypothetical protein
VEFKNLTRNINNSIDGDWLQDDGSVIRYTLDPLMGHIEKAEAGEWGEIAPYVEPEKTLEDIRAERVLLLAQNVDIYNPIRWAELSADQKDSVKTYRQALLDITKQEPASAIWPELPLI